MSNVKRVYVEKKPGFGVQAGSLKSEIRSYLGIKNVADVRVLIRYDVENISASSSKPVWTRTAAPSPPCWCRTAR